MVRSIEEERVYGETRSDAIGAEVAGSARRRNGRLAAMANGRLGGRPRARRFRTSARQVSLSRRVNKSGSARQDARHHAAVRSTSTCRSQPSSWFQLAKMRLAHFDSLNSQLFLSYDWFAIAKAKDRFVPRLQPDCNGRRALARWLR
jgi:hypothetical protein